MKSSVRQLIHIAKDLILLGLAFYLGFLIRFEGSIPPNFLKTYAWHFVPLIMIKITIFLLNNQYKKVWGYANFSEIISIVQSITISTVLFVGYIFFFKIPFPRSIIVLDWMLSILLLGGSDSLPRFWQEIKYSFGSPKNAKKVLIFGAGEAGILVLKEFRKHKELNTHIIGFIDDDSSKTGLEIHGVKVLGNREKITSLVQRNSVNEIIIAVPSAATKQIRDIYKLCTQSGVKVRILPGVYKIINGDVQLNQIREVQVEDLLGREPVQINMDEIAAYLSAKTVLITGGGGSIGSELCRQVAKFNPHRLVIFDISENSLYEIDLELTKSYPYLTVIPVVGSIRDKDRLRDIFKKYRPEVVFHAAAHKHVPLMEFNPGEAVKNNIFGTKNVAEVADEFGVERFVMVSTDKAVNPTNIMGATKRVAEMIIQDMNQRSKTKFVAVRFGNVLGSQGSVIPLFKKQIIEGGPITVTHPEITRYFMTIPEASQLVIQAGALGNGGEVFVLDMGKPVKIVDLAKDLIELSGLKLGEDIEIKITGLRPGEKLYEELLSDSEGTMATKHERILVAKLEEVDYKLLQQTLTKMEQMVANSLSTYMVSALVKLVVTFKPSKLHQMNELEEDAL